MTGFTDQQLFWFQVLLFLDSKYVEKIFKTYEKNPTWLTKDQRFAIQAIIALEED